MTDAERKDERIARIIVARLRERRKLGYVGELRFFVTVSHGGGVSRVRSESSFEEDLREGIREET